MIASIIHQAKYTHGGREFPHVDCYGMFQHIRRFLGLSVWPDMDITKQDDMHGAGLGVFRRKKPCKPSIGAFVACYDKSGFLRHCGCVVSDNGMLSVIDCTEKRGARCTELPRFKRMFHKVEFYQ